MTPQDLSYKGKCIEWFLCRLTVFNASFSTHLSCMRRSSAEQRENWKEKDNNGRSRPVVGVCVCERPVARAAPSPRSAWLQLGAPLTCTTCACYKKELRPQLRSATHICLGVAADAERRVKTDARPHTESRSGSQDVCEARRRLPEASPGPDRKLFGKANICHRTAA